MDQSIFKRLLFLITFTVVLVAIVVKLDTVAISLLKGLSIIQPLLLGAVIAFILNRPFKAFTRLFIQILPQRLKSSLKRLLALLATYIAFIGLSVALVAFVIPQFSQSIQVLYDNMDTYYINFQNMLQRGSVFIKFDQLDLTRFEALINNLPTLVGSTLTGLLPGVFEFTSSLIGSLLNIILGLILSIYILADKDHLKRQGHDLMQAYIEPRTRKKFIHALEVSNTTFGNFVIGQLTEATILGLLCFMGMLVFQFEYPLLISVLIGITSIIPIVGAVIGLVPSVLILLLVNPSHALGFLIYILVLMQVEGNLIYPRVVGGSIGLPALWVMTALIIGGGLFGVMGMLIGIPLASVIYQLVREDVQHRLSQGI